MRYVKLALCVLSAMTVVACSDDSGITDFGPPSAAALVRFINVNVDTGTVDLRFVDKVENLPTLLGVPFRGSSGLYQRVTPGARSTRVFPNSTNLALTQIMLIDKSVNLTADTHYTLVYAGSAGANQAQLAELADPATATPPANQIAIKALHAAYGTAAVDIYVVPVASTSAATPTDFATNNAGVIRNLGYLSQSAYVNVAVRPTTGTPLYRFVVTAAGATTALFATTPNLPGIPTPSGQLYGPQPGVQIAGSVLTVVLSAGTVPGTRQSTTANQSPSAFLIADKACTAAGSTCS